MKSELLPHGLPVLLAVIAFYCCFAPQSHAKEPTIQIDENGDRYANVSGRIQCKRFINECRVFREKGGKLTHLVLTAHELSVEEIAFISEISELKSLVLGDTGGMRVYARSGGLEQLSKLDNVEELTIALECVTAEDLSFIQSMDSLQELNLWLTHECILENGKNGEVVINGGRLFEAISGCSRLKYVMVVCDWRRCSFLDSHYAIVIGKTEVESVSFFGANAGKETFSAAGQSASLQYLDFGCREISGGDLESLAESRSLVSVCIYCDNVLSADKIGQVAAIPTLNTLKVGAAITGDLAHAFRSISGSTEIQDISLPFWDVQDADIHSLEKFKDLKILRVGCDRITQHGCRALAQRLSLNSMCFVGDAAKVNACNKWYKEYLQ